MGWGGGGRGREIKMGDTGINEEHMGETRHWQECIGCAYVAFLKVLGNTVKAS